MIEEFVKIYGEKHRRIIAESLAFLEANEAAWNLDEAIDRREYIAEIMASIACE